LKILSYSKLFFTLYILGLLFNLLILESPDYDKWDLNKSDLN